MDEKGRQQVPTTPQPPRKGRAGRPPSRGDDTDAKQESASGAHSFGQSAPMPGAGEPTAEGETRAPAHKVARVERKHQSAEDLAGEPMRESGEDEPPGVSSGNAYGDVAGANGELEALGDMPLGTEEGGPLRDGIVDDTQ